jgi:DHA1 family multidrug resistance protein-like MFS transporter
LRIEIGIFQTFHIILCSSTRAIDLTMSDLLRESAFGQLVRLATRNRLFRYPEEQDGFTCPSSYTGHTLPPKDESQVKEQDAITAVSATESVEKTELTESVENPTPISDQDLEKMETRSSSSSLSVPVDRTGTLGLQRTHTLAYTADRFAIEQALAVEKTKSRAIVPARTADNVVLADW